MPLVDARLARYSGQKTYRVVWSDAKTGRRRKHDTGCARRVDAEKFLEAWSASGGAASRAGVSGVSGALVSELFEAYLVRHKTIQNSQKLESQSQRANLAVLRARLGSSLVTDLTGRDLERVRDTLIREGRQPGTVRRYLSAMRAAVTWGVRAGLVSRDMRDALFGGLTLPPDSEASTLWLSRDERDMLFGLCLALIRGRDKHWRAAGAVCLALGTAARKGAVLGLTWSRVDRSAGVVDYRDPSIARSNKRRVPLPISSEVGETLDALAEITGPAGLVLRDRGDIRRGFDVIRGMTGLPDLQFKTLRSTWASLAAQRGVDLRLIADVLGDDVETTRKHYAHLSPAHYASAFN